MRSFRLRVCEARCSFGAGRDLIKSPPISSAGIICVSRDVQSKTIPDSAV